MDFLNIRLPIQKKLGFKKDYVAKLYPVADGKSLAVQYDYPRDRGVSFVFTHTFKDVAVSQYRDTELSFFNRYFDEYSTDSVFETTNTGNRYFIHNN